METQAKIKERSLYNMELNKDDYEWSFLIGDCTSIPLHVNANALLREVKIGLRNSADV